MSFVAISKVEFPLKYRDEIHRIGIEMLDIAKRQHGFIDIAFHQSLTKNETMMYWQWQTQADHEACMRSSDWLAVVKKSDDLFSKDGVEFSIETYSRLA